MYTAIYNYLKEIWSDKQFKAYIKVAGLLESTQNKLLDSATAYLPHVQQDRMDAVEAVSKVELPSSWNHDLEVWHHIDALMHLLFLGVAHSTQDLIFSLLSIPRKKTEFKRELAPLLEHIQGLSLD